MKRIVLEKFVLQEAKSSKWKKGEMFDTFIKPMGAPLWEYILKPGLRFGYEQGKNIIRGGFNKGGELAGAASDMIKAGMGRIRDRLSPPPPKSSMEKLSDLAGSHPWLAGATGVAAGAGIGFGAKKLKDWWQGNRNPEQPAGSHYPNPYSPGAPASVPTDPRLSSMSYTGYPSSTPYQFSNNEQYQPNIYPQQSNEYWQGARESDTPMSNWDKAEMYGHRALLAERIYDLAQRVKQGVSSYMQKRRKPNAPKTQGK